MTPDRLLRLAIIPALAELAATGIPDTFAARRFLLAIALQESGLRHRRQVTGSGQEDGPAVSYAQFEKNGGCKGVLTHPSSAKRMRDMCAAFDVEDTPQGLWEAIRYNDVLAAVAWRLLVYTLPMRLPATVSEGWSQYIAAWRPGRPHPKSWHANWEIATIVAEES